MSENQTPNDPESVDQPQSFVGHLLELRTRMLKAIAAVLLFCVVLLPFANEAYGLLAEPLLRHLPQGTQMIATQVASPFLTPLKFVLFLSFFIAIPVVLYQIWAFVAPGLYKHEKRLVTPLLISSTVLFYAGAAFAYFVVFPLIFGFFANALPEGVAMMTDINEYLDFVLVIFLAFGLAFEVPIATILLVRMGIVEIESLRGKRPYIIVAAFVLGMVLTPPDVISQMLLAGPIWILFEIGLLFAQFFTPEESGAESETK